MVALLNVEHPRQNVLFLLIVGWLLCPAKQWSFTAVARIVAW